MRACSCGFRGVLMDGTCGQCGALRAVGPQHPTGKVMIPASERCDLTPDGWRVSERILTIALGDRDDPAGVAS